MIGLSFAAPAAKLCEALGLRRKTALQNAERFLLCRQLLALDGIGEAAEPVALHVLDPARVARRRDGGVDGQLGRVGDAVLGGNGLNVALAEDGVAAAAVGALTSSCGDVTTTTPATGRDWNTVSGTSPVPGGMSTNI